MLNLLLLLSGLLHSSAQTMLRLSKEEIITINGTPDSQFTDTSGYLVLQYIIRENISESVNAFAQRINFFLENNRSSKREHFIPAKYYTIQAAYFDRSYKCAYDQQGAAWITGYKTFYRMNYNDAFVFYTEETFE